MKLLDTSRLGSQAILTRRHRFSIGTGRLPIINMRQFDELHADRDSWNSLDAQDRDFLAELQLFNKLNNALQISVSESAWVKIQTLVESWRSDYRDQIGRCLDYTPTTVGSLLTYHST
jgi:hypothetical protein